MDHADTPLPPAAEVEQPRIEEASQPYVGRWNRLVSTTNWEKGRIITQWREALMEAGTPAAEYSDESWSRRVGSVTGQHIGRLRRVYQRFGEVYEQYEGLYWSHFQASLDWEDAEMWLEGAVQNQWSVSQMRRTRWETMGAITDQEPQDSDIVTAEVDEDFEPSLAEAPESTGAGNEPAAAPSEPKDEETSDRETGDEDTQASPADSGANIYAEEDTREAIEFVRPFENLADLPEDLGEAFEAFKLAILRHKTEGWSQISSEDVLASLDALKELVAAPSADEAPF